MPDPLSLDRNLLDALQAARERLSRPAFKAASTATDARLDVIIAQLDALIAHSTPAPRPAEREGAADGGAVQSVGESHSRAPQPEPPRRRSSGSSSSSSSRPPAKKR